MALGRVILVAACLSMTAGAQAAPSTNARLSLDLRTLDGGEVSYHPSRWLSLRRSFAFVRPDPVADVTTTPAPTKARPRAYAMTGDFHPFGGGFRLSIGVREDANRRLLRGVNDRDDIPTAQYAPTISLGYGEEIGDGLSVGGDVGLLGKDMSAARDGVLVTPVEMTLPEHDDGRALKPVLRLSAGYRF